MKEKYEESTALCLCGSGLSYNECCKKKINPNQSEAIHNSFMDELDKKRKNCTQVCLHPQKDKCDYIIGAHTISRRAVLSLIAENNEVLMPVVHGPTNKFKMEPKGIKDKATKFHCFCHNHDAIFNPIDQPAVVLNKYTFFLYAYRTFASTYHKVMRELDCYKALRQKYDMTCNPLAILFYIQTENYLPALNWYKNKFDEAILTNSYDKLESLAITLGYRVYFAAATCFCPMFDIFGNPIIHDKFDLPMLYISVIPDENQTKLIFSWFKEDHCIYGFLEEQLKIAPTRLTLKYLNNLLPLNCENMTVGPLLWNSWSATAKEDFVNVAYNRIKNEAQKDISKTYFEDRAYYLFMKL